MAEKNIQDAFVGHINRGPAPDSAWRGSIGVEPGPTQANLCPHGKAKIEMRDHNTNGIRKKYGKRRN